MFTTDKKELEKYYALHRVWQGIPGIEVTKKGRIFLTCYSGFINEGIGNYCILMKSDNGTDFSEPIAVAYPDDSHRCYDPCLWIDPLGRLWFVWSYIPEHAVYAVICEDPDADTLQWSEPMVLGRDVMMNKPTVLSTGEWLFPIAVWRTLSPYSYGDSTDTDRRSFVYRTVDNGRTFEKYGGAAVPERYCDEHMVLEMRDGSLSMFVRTTKGIGIAHSYDGGRTWVEEEEPAVPGQCSRFFIRRLRSGRVLLVYHHKNTGRSHITAMLSEDEGKTWPHKLLLDERSNVSYPDGKEADDGYLYITYDRERGNGRTSLEDVYTCAREILIAKITEADIMAGELVDSGSRLKMVASRLGEFVDEDPYQNVEVKYEKDMTKHLVHKTKERLLYILFEYYQINCMNMHRLDSEKLDALIAQLDAPDCDREKVILTMVRLIASVSDRTVTELPVIERVKEILVDSLGQELPIGQIARQLGMSLHYMCHAFKKTTGLTITEYKNNLRIARAKRLLINSSKKVSDIAWECGFGSPSYFSKKFTASQQMSPTQYRSIKINERCRGKKCMLITDPKELLQYDAPHRVWQGIPGIEVTKKGRIFVTFYSGKTSETVGNYCLLLKSDDGGASFSKPIAAIYADEDHRCYDPCLWMDPLGRLWFFWAYAPDHGAFGVYCEDPDADVLRWSEPVRMGKDVMMNKPTVLQNGDWLFPIAVWKRVLAVIWARSDDTHRLAFAYRSKDQGRTFEQLGGSDVAGRTFDEHMILELRDGRLAMYVRTDYGIAVSYSGDGGNTWSEGEDTGWGGPDSRFFIRRLRSGRVLLINHYQHTGRSHLTAMLSEDDGKTWPYKLLLDERQSVSYPDAVEAPDGNIYITYDRERGCFLNSMDKVYACAREVLIARITEADILAGKIVSDGSYQKRVASKLGEYADGDPFVNQ